MTDNGQKLADLFYPLDDLDPIPDDDTNTDTSDQEQYDHE